MRDGEDRQDIGHEQAEPPIETRPPGPGQTRAEMLAQPPAGYEDPREPARSPEDALEWPPQEEDTR